MIKLQLWPQFKALVLTIHTNRSLPQYRSNNRDRSTHSDCLDSNLHSRMPSEVTCSANLNKLLPLNKVQDRNILCSIWLQVYILS